MLAKREQLILLRVDQQNLLLMTVLKYAAQVRSPALFAEQLTAAPPPAAEERALWWSSDFDAHKCSQNRAESSAPKTASCRSRFGSRPKSTIRCCQETLFFGGF